MNLNSLLIEFFLLIIYVSINEAFWPFPSPLVEPSARINKADLPVFTRNFAEERFDAVIYRNGRRFAPLDNG